MSQWGVFHDDRNQVHVAPRLPDGRLPVNHALHEHCKCGPKFEETRQVDADGYRMGIYIHQDARSCTCHPDDNPPRPCPQNFALTECRKAAELREQVNAVALECAQSTRKAVEAIRASEKSEGGQ